VVKKEGMRILATRLKATSRMKRLFKIPRLHAESKAASRQAGTSFYNSLYKSDNVGHRRDLLSHSDKQLRRATNLFVRANRSQARKDRRAARRLERRLGTAKQGSIGAAERKLMTVKTRFYKASAKVARKLGEGAALSAR
jgi:hypothetical protein